MPATKRSSNKKRIILLATALLIVIAGAYIYWQGRQPAPSQSVEDTGTNIGVPPTYTAETEGQEIQVPESVPKESIKNYELITENEQFKIRKLDGEYTITLYAIINRPEQYDQYKDQLREYKQKALEYLQNDGVDTNSVKIIYEPEEASDL